MTEERHVCGMSSAQVAEVLAGNEIDCIRNVAIVAHVDAGKSTLCDVLLARSGLIGRNASCALDSMEDEKARGITIKAAAVTLGYELGSSNCVINLIDCPGHVDFSSEVTASLRVADGCFIVIDSVEGVQVQTEAVIRNAVRERVVPALVINKIDRLMMQLGLSPEDAYQQFVASSLPLEGLIGEAGPFAEACKSELHRSLCPRAEENSVCFTAGLKGWGFSLRTFADLISRKYRVPAAGGMENRLWGDWYFNDETKRFTRSQLDGSGQKLERTFCRFVLRPLYSILHACRGGKADELSAAVAFYWPEKADSFRAETELLGDNLFHHVMKTLLPASDALVGLAEGVLPSPRTAQRYRAEVLVEEGEEELMEAVRRCDPEGPLVMFISKMVPIPKTWNFYAFGRVFSGTLSSGSEVRVLEGGVPSRPTKLQSVVVMMGHREERTQKLAAGCPAAVGGLSDIVSKSGTVVAAAIQEERQTAMRPLQLDLSPVVTSSVECSKAADKVHLVKALRWLAKSDPLVKCTVENNETVVAAAGELHLEVCLKQLRDRMNGPPGAETADRKLTVSEPAVPYKETVTTYSSQQCLAKSSNKLNRIYVTAEPLAEGIAEAIEKREISQPRDLLAWGWTSEEVKSVMHLDRLESGPNILVNATKGVPNINDVRQHLVSAFSAVMGEAVLCGGGARGVRINIEDVMIHPDNAHRGPSEIIPAARRAMSAAILCSEPQLLEPIFDCKIDTSETHAGGVRSLVPRRRGVTYDEQHTVAGVCIAASVPVSSSFGMAQELRSRSGGKSSMQCSFSHWAPLPETLFDEAVSRSRAKNGLRGPLPQFKDYIDRL
eukprot:TRINITY_DN18653_c0_g2_i2.p1 TRINITY_DN18653_c0_g2~~TRINITY_DN18653_c0_g2_i2.p1  ORF type:complete len:835 (+),score=155.59 TRINITY_DN18653_c0_g2_i2:2849-5353(+)